MGVNKVVYGGNTLIDLSSDTVAANKMLSGTKAHDKAGNAITGSIATQAAQTITPGTADQTIAAGKYLSGAQTIKGDANLKAENIAKGVTIFGVTGTHEGGEDVSAETAEYTELLTDLETAIDALPDAGSGGSSGGTNLETCTVTIPYYEGSAKYFNGEQLYDGARGDSFIVNKNSIMILNTNGIAISGWTIEGNAQLLNDFDMAYAFAITGDCTLNAEEGIS